MKAEYLPFSNILTYEGDYDKWEAQLFNSDSKIGIIIGARGKGKTALGIKLAENLYAKNKKKIYAIGFQKIDMPAWIHVIEQVDEITNNSFVLIDEGGVLFSSRESMSKPNKLLSDLILIARHKNLSILFISQNCLPLTEKICTPEGIRTLGELRKNDTIYAFDFDSNKLVAVPSIKSPNITKKIVKIHLEDGRILYSSEEHRWIVYDENGLSQIKAVDLNSSKHYLVDVSGYD